MSNHVHQQLERAGLSAVSVNDAASTAVAKAPEAVRNIRRFTLGEPRGHGVEGKVAHRQVSLKRGFTLE